jgi:2-polyprenyl-6-methoxyphenol hydroxylase-like FAD-dependent oxidoreductase
MRRVMRRGMMACAQLASSPNFTAPLPLMNQTIDSKQHVACRAPHLPPAPEQRVVDCCIVGGGPAGVVLSLLLARQGVEVVLIEAHEDFDRDFRGDPLHPSTVQLLDQLRLKDRLLRLPHVRTGDFPTHYPDGSISPGSRRQSAGTRYEMPQSELLFALASHARGYATFHLEMGARAETLLEYRAAVSGVRYRTRDGWRDIAATLVVGVDALLQGSSASTLANGTHG